LGGSTSCSASSVADERRKSCLGEAHRRVSRLPGAAERNRPRNGTGSVGRRSFAAVTGKTATMGARIEPITGDDGAGRNETHLERCDRNLVELLQEVRVVQTGVQVLFAFLLTAPLAARFAELSDFQRLTYFGTLLAAGAAAVLLIAPTAYHRILFRLGDKEHLVAVANRFTLAGLTCVALSMVGALLLVTDLLFDATAVIAGTTALAAVGCLVCWCLAPLARRARIGRRPASESVRSLARGTPEPQPGATTAPR
jgi:Family of unknown function (DUF6328)